MNERIKQLAEQAGIEFTHDPTEKPIRAFVECWEDEMAKFADLIRADEREACAKVCDDEVGTWTGWPQAQDALVVGAIAIRARGNT
jgi:predicted acetyltransferase